jgi:type I restriction enzyme S subunit
MNNLQYRGDIHIELECGNAGGNYHEKLGGTGGMKTLQAPLKEVTSFIKRGITPKYVEDDGICVLNQKCIRDGRVSLDPARLTNKNIHINAEKVLQNGDILINSTGTGTLGRTAPFFYSNGIEQAVVDTHVTIVRPETGTVNARYLAYVLRQCEPTIVNMAKGATNQVELSARDVGLLPIKLRDRQEQDRIASILSAYDDLIENNRRRIQLLEQAARLIYREWFVYFRFPGYEHVSITDGVPEGWRRVPLQEVCKRITDGSHSSPQSIDEGFPMASVKDMHDWGFNIDQCRKISHQDFDLLVKNDCKPLKNDVLIAKDGSYLKHTFVVQEEIDFVILSSIAILRPNHLIDPHLLNFILRDPRTKMRMTGYVSGVALPRIILKEFRGFEILLPPVELQRLWAIHANPIAVQCYQLGKQNEALTKARDLLLPRLMNGEVVV